MHPASRILCLIALAAGLAGAAPLALGFASALLALATIATQAPWRLWWQAFYRLRWLFISLIVLYGWFTPGDPVWPALGMLSSSWQGLSLWALRVWMLWLLGGAARLLMHQSSREELIAGLLWLLHPLERMGMSPARFCLRLVLALEYTLAFKPAVTKTRQPRGNLIQSATQVVQKHLQATEERAANAPLDTIRVPACGAPPLLEVLMATALMIALWLLAAVTL